MLFQMVFSSIIVAKFCIIMIWGQKYVNFVSYILFFCYF